MSELLAALLRLNLAAGLAVALVMALRLPARRLFGAGVAYGLWALVPLAALAMIAPARVVRMAETAWPASAQVWAAPSAVTTALPVAHLPDLAPLLAGLWIAGAAASLAWLAWRQVRFLAALRDGVAGPAVIGILRPRVVTPSDFASRYTEREQQVILAHERSHIARHDARINALAALARCLCWFNPMAHLAAHLLRIDQELACDARVVAAHPTARRAYAEAMLKTQLAAHPLPLGCYWPAGGVHPLAERIALLSRRRPSRAQRWAGSALVVVLGVGGGWSAWAARPADIVWTPAPAPTVAEVPASRTPSPPRRVAPASKPAPTSAPASPPSTVTVAEPNTAAPAAAPLQVERISDPAPQPDMAPAFTHRIHAVANRSAVEPGWAVRVLAKMTDPDGLPLVTDLTAYGSQRDYRTGYFTRDGSRYALFTAVVQQGERLLVSASLDAGFRAFNSGTIALAPGQTGTITLGDGQQVTVTPSLRAETPEEIEDGQRLAARRASFHPRGFWDAVFP